MSHDPGGCLNRKALVMCVNYIPTDSGLLVRAIQSIAVELLGWLALVIYWRGSDSRSHGVWHLCPTQPCLGKPIEMVTALLRDLASDCLSVVL